jgi:hypothetical protein
LYRATHSVFIWNSLPKRSSKASSSAHALFDISGLGDRAVVMSGLFSSHCRYPPGSAKEGEYVSMRKVDMWHTEHKCTNVVVRPIWHKSQREITWRTEQPNQHFHQVLQQWLDSVALDGADDGADMHDVKCANEMRGQIWSEGVHDVHTHVSGEAFRGWVVGRSDIEAGQGGVGREEAGKFDCPRAVGWAQLRDCLGSGVRAGCWFMGRRSYPLPAATSATFRLGVSLGIDGWRT